MGVDPLSLALIGTTVAGGTSSFLGAKKTSRDAEAAERRGARELDRVDSERREREKQGAQSEALRKDRERQRALFMMSQGRAGTTKTSKIGVPGGGQTYAAKTAIGA